MVNQSNRSLLRLTGGCFALALASLFSLPASALATSFAGTFEDRGGNLETEGDSFVLTNDPASTEDILTVVFDLSTAVTGTTFDPATQPFQANGADVIATGFTGEVVTATTLTLMFTDFNVAESFRFTIDLDDDDNVVQGASIAGSTVTATFAISGDVVAVMADTGGDTAAFSRSGAGARYLDAHLRGPDRPRLGRPSPPTASRTRYRDTLVRRRSTSACRPSSPSTGIDHLTSKA